MQVSIAITDPATGTAIYEQWGEIPDQPTTEDIAGLLSAASFERRREAIEAERESGRGRPRLLNPDERPGRGPAARSAKEEI